MPRRFLAGLACALIAALLLASCGASDDAEPSNVADRADSTESSSSTDSSSSTESSPGPSDSETDTDSNTATDTDDAPMAASSPIGAFFADSGGFQAAIEAFNVRVEEEIVLCMAQQGFEYNVGAQFNQSEVFEEQQTLSTRDWTTKYGYGVSTGLEAFVQQQMQDPNGELMATMSEAERELWLGTLLGDGFNDPTRFDDGPPPLDEQGCVGSGIITAGGQEVVEGLNVAFADFEEGGAEIQDRPEVIEAIGEWSRCLGQAGYPDFAALEDPQADIQAKLDAIIAPVGEIFGELEGEEIQAFLEGAQEDLASVPGLDVDALRDLQAEEITLALTDLDCIQAHVTDVVDPLRDAFEQGLLDTYADEFDAVQSLGE